ncbi:MAG TPA: hypothetical protein VGJ25_12150 [Gaiellaceae bacterium]
MSYWDAGEPPEAVIAQYRRAAEAVVGFDAYLSVKATALAFSAELAGQLGSRLHFDSMAPDTVDATLALLERLDGDLGTTLPSRWRRSDRDAERALELGLRVRLVKGQWESGDDREPREGFLALIDRLAGRARHVAVATHDRALAAEALRRLGDTPTELEQLYGLPLAPPRARVYVPFGRGYLPYALRQVRRDPRIAWWVARDLVRSR